jgi:hypothetical protein
VEAPVAHGARYRAGNIPRIHAEFGKLQRYSSGQVYMRLGITTNDRSIGELHSNFLANLETLRANAWTYCSYQARRLCSETFHTGYGSLDNTAYRTAPTAVHGSNHSGVDVGQQ